MLYYFTTIANSIAFLAFHWFQVLGSFFHSQEITEVATKVYVGGIPYYSTEDDIRSYFESCGTITEVDCMKFRESGKFRGIAIINFKVGTYVC